MQQKRTRSSTGAQRMESSQIDRSFSRSRDWVKRVTSSVLALFGLYTILPQMISSKLQRERERENCTSGGVSVPSIIYLHARWELLKIFVVAFICDVFWVPINSLVCWFCLCCSFSFIPLPPLHHPPQPSVNVEWCVSWIVSMRTDWINLVSPS